MFSKSKNWMSGGIWKPKNPHSLEHLKYLYNVLCKNQVVTEQNKSLLVESLRSIAEILIWGDQNDSTVFDFFLEKNMLSFFLRFMRQKSGRFICVQLLQTLNILFENISNETSVYYLLSNNHINSIIVHKFDFSDEEVMAYYISFLKTLSLKLNKHTIHFFYNEHTYDFALYTEGIKFFNHSESMVRIAVRTITLNVYAVDDKSMLRYIRDRTAAPYFTNLVWFIGSHVIDLDSCVRNDADHNSRDRLANMVAEHLDHLHYLNDILCLHIEALNEVLSDHLINRLFIPLYVYSLTKRRKFTGRSDDRPHIKSLVSLFLLSQVFLIISHAPLVRQLADIIFNGDLSVCLDTPDTSSPQTGRKVKMRGFIKPTESLAQTLDNATNKKKKKKKKSAESENKEIRSSEEKDTEITEAKTEQAADGVGVSTTEGSASEDPASDAPVINETEDLPAPSTSEPLYTPLTPVNQNSTDEEKLLSGSSKNEQIQASFTLNNRPYLDIIFNSLECSENDYEALFALCMLYALGHNQGLNQELLDAVLIPTDRSPTKMHYNVVLVEKLIKIISLSCQINSRVRLATLEMALLVLNQLVYGDSTCHLQDRHLAALEGAREEGTLLLRNFYKSEEIFLDMFEDEYREMKSRPLNVEYLMMDASILLPPTGTPLTGIDFNKRLPCGEVERARRAIRVFFLLRDLSLHLRQETETQLPLTKQEECVKVNDVLDLNNSDLIACTVITRDNKKDRRFLVIDVLQLILVEPDSRRLGWGVVKFVGFLQDVEVTGDKDDSRSLHITIHKPSLNVHARPLPLLSARFLFDDHIRCMAAKQRLTKGRLRARQRKMQMIARLLELPSHIVDSMYQPAPYSQSAAQLRAAQQGDRQQNLIPGRSHPGRAARAGGAVGAARPVTVDGSQPSAFSPVASRSQRNKASFPIPIRSGPLSGVPQPSSGTQSPEIEEAEEALPSPDVAAARKLSNVSGGSAMAAGSGSKQLDIPMEDMSQRARAAITHARHFLEKSDAQAKVRSSSYSPVRLGVCSESPSASLRGRSSLLARRLSEERSRSTGRLEVRKRGASIPNTEGASTKTGLISVSTKPETSEQNKDTTKPRSGSDPQDQTPTKANKKDTKPRKRTKSGPKTLTPAVAPTVSLLGSDPAIVSADSPKLLPPVRPEYIRSISQSDTHSETCSDTHSDGNVCGDLPLPFPAMKRSLLADMVFADEEEEAGKEQEAATNPQQDQQVSDDSKQVQDSSEKVSTESTPVQCSDSAEHHISCEEDQVSQVADSNVSDDKKDKDTESQCDSNSAEQCEDTAAVSSTAAESSDTATSAAAESSETAASAAAETSEPAVSASSTPAFLKPARSRPSVSENQASAGLVETSGSLEETATEELSKLALTPPKSYTVLEGSDSIELCRQDSGEQSPSTSS